MHRDPTHPAHQWHNPAVNTTTNRAALSGLAALAAVGISVGLLLASTVPNLVFSDNLIIDTVVRKIGHFVAFGAFAVAGCIGLHHLLPVGRAARLVVLVAIAIALADELTQTRCRRSPGLSDRRRDRRRRGRDRGVSLSPSRRGLIDEERVQLPDEGAAREHRPETGRLRCGMRLQVDMGSEDDQSSSVIPKAGQGRGPSVRPLGPVDEEEVSARWNPRRIIDAHDRGARTDRRIVEPAEEHEVAHDRGDLHSADPGVGA